MFQTLLMTVSFRIGQGSISKCASFAAQAINSHRLALAFDVTNVTLKPTAVVLMTVSFRIGQGCILKCASFAALAINSHRHALASDVTSATLKLTVRFIV